MRYISAKNIKSKANNKNGATNNSKRNKKLSKKGEIIDSYIAVLGIFHLSTVVRLLTIGLTKCYNIFGSWEDWASVAYFCARSKGGI